MPEAPTEKPSKPLKTQMNNIIHIERLSIFGRHGVMPQETIVGAMFYVTLEITLEVSEQAFKHDQLSGTVSYADIIDKVRSEMSHPVALLEHLVYRVGNTLIDTFPTIHKVRVRIDKENPPCGASVHAIGLETEITRNQEG